MPALKAKGMKADFQISAQSDPKVTPPQKNPEQGLLSAFVAHFARPITLRAKNNSLHTFCPLPGTYKFLAMLLTFVGRAHGVADLRLMIIVPDRSF
jgi:hypothetical protein